MQLSQAYLVIVMGVCFLENSIMATPQQQPQRSIQLGGIGPRPVSLSPGTPAPQPSFSQQLAFGPQLQLQQQPQQFRQPQPQAAQLQSNFFQQQQLVRNFPPIGSFPNPPNPTRPQHQQPLLLNSPQTPTTTASTEEEYEDEEYEDTPPAAQPQQPFRAQVPNPPPQLRPQFQQLRVTPTPRAIPQRQPQQSEITPTPVGPPRFIIQSQQSQAPQIRRPVQAPPLQLQQQRTQQQQLQLQQQPLRQYGQDSRLIDPDRQTSTPVPIKTIDRYMRTNEDGSTSWGYTNEDGTFKEETLGVDCVVRGKYGYVDPDGVKREYEYQSGNPCDPNKRGQPEEDELDEEVGQQRQRLAGILNARPTQIQYQPQPQPQPQHQQFRQRQQQQQSLQQQ